MEELKITIDGKEHKVRIEETEDGKIRVHTDKEVYEVETKQDIEAHLIDDQEDSDKENNKIIKAPLPGIIYTIDIKPKQQIKKGKRLLSMMAMKMENEIRSPADGIVKEIKVKKDQKVNKGDVLILLE